MEQPKSVWMEELALMIDEAGREIGWADGLMQSQRASSVELCANEIYIKKRCRKEDLNDNEV